MLKYVSKLAMDILPSVAATVIGAYIVNHYMVNRPAPEPAATASSVDPKKAEVKTEVKRSDAANDVDPVVSGNRSRAAAEKAGEPSEKSVSDNSAGDKPQEKAAEKPADRPADVASLPAEPRRHQPVPREKAAAAASPAVGVAQPAQVEAMVGPEEHRDANELARAAIERLRASGGGATRTSDAVRGPDATSRVTAAPPVAAAPPAAVPIRPLPAPILVSTPPANGYDSAPGPSQSRSSYPPAVIASDPLRPTPPADIPRGPMSPPLDLHADSTGEIGHKSVAEGMFSAAKSVFLAVLPK